MRRGRTVSATAFPLLLVLGLVSLCPASAAIRGDDDSAALVLLRRAVQAARTVPYRGTQVIATWTPAGTTTRVLDVRQQTGGLREVTVRGTGTGTGTGTTSTWTPTGATAIDPLVLLAGAFALTVDGRGVVAGRPATVVRAERRGRVVARLWVDDATGLMLREEVLDAAGQLTRMVTFLDVQPLAVLPAQRTSSPVAGGQVAAGAVGQGAAGTGGPSAAGQAPATGTRSAVLATGGDGWVPASPDPAATARQLGSPCPDALPGGYRLVDVRSEPLDGGHSAVHLTYSDGLSALSVFVQAGRLPAGGVPGLNGQIWDGVRVFVGDGWPARVVWQGGGYVLTVVSDAPLDDVQEILVALPHASGGGVLRRIGAVLHAASVLLPGH